MALDRGFAQRFETKLGVRVDPRVVLSSKLLQLGQQELEQAIEAEINENPALERLESGIDPLDDETILRSVAPHELRPGSEDFEFHRSLPQDEASPDWVDLAASTTSIWDHLRAQLLPGLPKRLRPLGAYLIECVNERGYLTSSIEEAALHADASMEDAEFVLAKLRECEPSGVGATNVQECLLLQLRQAENLEQKLARAIIRDHFDDFLNRKTLRIARKYRVIPDVVEAAFAEILSLSPFPGEAFNNTRGARPIGGGVRPDVILSRSEAGWTVEVAGADANSLCINRAYQKRLDAAGKDRRVDKDEKRHLSTFVGRAQEFISCVAQRKKTLIAIGRYLTESQSGFVSTGDYQFLQPLTRAQLASDLGVHESTVSRATQEKFVQLANGEIVAFEVFFKPALRVQKMIEEILSLENPDSPLSDERIAAILAEKGVQVARRTVNKYRDRTKMLSSRKRKSA